MGFSAKESRMALQTTGGALDEAVALLLSAAASAEAATAEAKAKAAPAADVVDIDSNSSFAFSAAAAAFVPDSLPSSTPHTSAAQEYRSPQDNPAPPDVSPPPLSRTAGTTTTALEFLQSCFPATALDSLAAALEQEGGA